MSKESHAEGKHRPEVGSKFKFTSWRALINGALQLSAEGYGVEVIGFNDMSENILTITALPEGETCETN